MESELSPLSMTNGQRMEILAALGYTNKEQCIFTDIVEVYNQDNNAKKALWAPGANGRSVRARLFRDWMLAVYEILKSSSASDAGTVYYVRLRRPRLDNGRINGRADGIIFSIYSAPEFKAFVSRTFLSVFSGFSASADVKEAYQTLTLSINELLDTVPDRWFYIGGGLAFDRGEANTNSTAQLVDLDDYIADDGSLRTNMPRIFYKFFDTPDAATRGDNDIVAVPQMTPEMTALLKDTYFETLRALSEDRNIKKLEEIDQWACGFEDRYRDIIHMASARMKSHDFGVYLLTGVGRNGKSSCIDLIASLYGVSNVCRVQVDKLGDRHNLQNFKRALLNLPDEQKAKDQKERTMSGDASVAFRIAANHGAVNMDVMGSNSSDMLYYDFVTIAPVNSVPNFPSDVQKACIDRCRIIEFQGDFSESDMMGVKWGKVHFTPEFMMKFAGQTMAFASYYSSIDHPWNMTDMMKLARDKQYENSASDVAYMKIWEKLFCGFDSYATLLRDYANYCKLMDIPQAELNKNSILLLPYNTIRWRDDPFHGKYRCRVNQLAEAKCKKRIMSKYDKFSVKAPDESGKKVTYEITGKDNIDSFLSDGRSIIYELEDMNLLNRSEQLMFPFQEDGR